MGSPASPEIADIAFHKLECRIIETYMDKISLWTRFRDVIFMLFRGTQTELNILSEKIHEMHPTLKFSLVSSETEVVCLDLVIYKGHRLEQTKKLDIKTYTKL